MLKLDLPMNLEVPSLSLLNTLIEKTLRHIPYHNLTVLVRPRRPPTPEEIRHDFLSGIGGPCAVVNAGFASLLHALGFTVSLLPATIDHKQDCHVAILVSLQGRTYYVDVGNGKPYLCAAALGDAPRVYGETFPWRLVWRSVANQFELLHGKRMGDDEISWSSAPAICFNPRRTVKYTYFRPMIERSRTDRSYGVALRSLRLCRYPDPSRRVGLRDAQLINGNSTNVAAAPGELLTFASLHFAPSVVRLVREALEVLMRQGDSLWGDIVSFEGQPPYPIWTREAEWVHLLRQCLELKPFSASNIIGVQQTLSFVSTLLEQRGFDIRRFRNDNVGADAIVALRGPRGPTTDWIGLFGHVDIEEVRTEKPWQCSKDPLTPLVGEDGRWYCRGVADNLGPLLARILAFNASDKVSRGVCWTIHGEEEIGSHYAHRLYPHLADKVPQVKLVNLWLEETGYFTRDGAQRVLILNEKADSFLLQPILQFLQKSCEGDGRRCFVERRALNKAFGIDTCPCLINLLKESTPYLSIGINDSFSNIHVADESISRKVLTLADRQFRHVMGLPPLSHFDPRSTPPTKGLGPSLASAHGLAYFFTFGFPLLNRVPFSRSNLFHFFFFFARPSL